MKPKVIVTKGLPASGKSTWTKHFCERNKNFIRINKDDIRAMMANEFSKPREQIVLEMRNAGILGALTHGFGVIVDDTNFEPVHLESIERIVKHFPDMIIEVKEFDVPLSVCLERNKKRPNSVPEDVIISMADKYGWWKEMREFDLVKQDPTLPRAIIVDIDGTIAHMTGRSPYDYSRVWEDAVHNDVVHIISTVAASKDCKILLVSGRPESCRRDTLKWLFHNTSLIVEDLYMRKTDDKRSDSIVKYEILQELIKKYFIELVFDDRDRVVKMWREAGLRCLQVAPGAF